MPTKTRPPRVERNDAMIATEQLAETFVEIADTLVEDFDLIDFLHMLTSRTAELTNTVSAGLLLSDPHGRLQFMAASQESVKLLELFQLQNKEGPCLDCFRTGVPVFNTDLARAASSWPLFAPRAVAGGFRSVHAFPLRHRSRVLGAMNLFGSETGELDAADVRIIQALADVATIGLLQERTIRGGELLTEQLQGALNSRVTIEQAKGFLARTRNIDVDAAFDQMRQYARSNHLRLGDVARDVVASPKAHPQLTERP